MVKIKFSIMVGLKLEFIVWTHLIVPVLASIEKNSFLLLEKNKLSLSEIISEVCKENF